MCAACAAARRAGMFGFRTPVSAVPRFRDTPRRIPEDTPGLPQTSLRAKIHRSPFRSSSRYTNSPLRRIPLHFGVRPIHHSPFRSSSRYPNSPFRRIPLHFGVCPITHTPVKNSRTKLRLRRLLCCALIAPVPAMFPASSSASSSRPSADSSSATPLAASAPPSAPSQA